MGTETEIMIKDLVWSIRRLVRAVYLDSAKISRQFGLTGPQSAVLRILFNSGSLSSAELSRQLYVTPSNITGIIDRLEKKGLVERTRRQGDRRIVLITLTGKGEDLSKALPDPIERKLIYELADLNPDRVQQLGGAMNQILQLIDARGVEKDPLKFGQGTSLNKDIR